MADDCGLTDSVNERAQALAAASEALEGICNWYGRSHIQPYPHEPMAWRQVREAIRILHETKTTMAKEEYCE